MLAQNFKTAQELGLTEAGLRSLVRVLHMLETGELVWTPQHQPIPNGFNMATTMSVHECGTVGCIGGWAHFYGERNDPSFIGPRAFTTGGPNKLGELFSPPRWSYGKHTVEQAAHALRTYLVTGTPDWT